MSKQVKELKRAMAVGAAWMMALRVSYRLIGLVSTVILARLLTPDDFGVAAIAMSVFALVNIFTQFGFETVLIQRKKFNVDDYNTAWTYNLLFGFASALVLFFSSEYIGQFYDNKDIEHVTIATSILFILHGLRNIGVVDFQKNLTFDKEFKLQIVPKFISFFVIICLAFYLRNFWALVIGGIVLKAMEVVSSYLMHPFRPSFSLRKSKDLFGFSKWLFVNNVLAFIDTKSPELILGKLMSPHAVAIYSLASEIGKLTTGEVIANLNRAIYPGYAKVSSDLQKLRDLYMDSVRVIALIAMPLGTGVALVSAYIVPIMLGDQWLVAIEPVVYIALGGSVTALKSNSNYVYLALGKPQIGTAELFIRGMIFVPLMVYLMDINGVVGVAQSFLITSILMFFVSIFILKAVLHISVYTQLKLYVKPLVATLVMALFVGMFTTQFAAGNQLISLLFAVVIGVVSYVGTVLLVWLILGKADGFEKQAMDVCMARLRR